jgi:hypothetical protein
VATKTVLFGTLLCLVTLAPALARPPTVTTSPGYDARLAESRKAWAAQAAQPVQAVPLPGVTVPKDRKKKRATPN